MSAPRERPILFSGLMVRAILDGSKTQTRRVVNPQPATGVRYSPFVQSGLEDKHGRGMKPPYFVGDRLWVRETWTGWALVGAGNLWRLRYQADGVERDLIVPESWNPPRQLERGEGWSSPILMPRWASRITLEVTKVRCQRLQEISEADVEAEGLPRDRILSHAAVFAEGWDLLNAKRGYPWSSNAWAWAVTFRRIVGAG